MNAIPATVTAIALLATSATAESVVFSADFNADAPGLNTSPAGFNLTQGNTDILGNGPSGEFGDFQPGNGYYVSLVGSGSGAAGLATDQVFEAGSYVLTFDLAGNNQGSTDETVTVGLGGFTESIFLDGEDFLDPFATQSFSFITDVAGALTFDTVDSPGQTNDDLGAFVDNIVLTLVEAAAPVVPAAPDDTAPTAVPSPLALPAGLLGLTALMTRRRRNA